VLAAIIIGVANPRVLQPRCNKRGLRPATIVALVASTFIPIAARTVRLERVSRVLRLGRDRVRCCGFLLGDPRPAVRSRVSPARCWCSAYVGRASAGFAGLILASKHGVGIILGVGALCVIAYDVFGFFVGSQFGRHADRRPSVSPQQVGRGHGGPAMLGAIIVGGPRSSVSSGPVELAPGSRARESWSPAARSSATSASRCSKRDLGLKDFGRAAPRVTGGVLDRFGLAPVLPADRLLPGRVYLKIW